jgi:hypothetical protein
MYNIEKIRQIGAFRRFSNYKYNTFQRRCQYPFEAPLEYQKVIREKISKKLFWAQIGSKITLFWTQKHLRITLFNNGNKNNGKSESQSMERRLRRSVQVSAP